MEYLKHIKEDLEMFLYKQLEADEANGYVNINTEEIDKLTHAIKNLAEANYYCSNHSQDVLSKK